MASVSLGLASIRLTYLPSLSRSKGQSSPFRILCPGLSASPSNRHLHGFQKINDSLLYTVRAETSGGSGRSTESANVSVFRFTLGIPGFNDSDLPRVSGTLFGGLLILNHLFSLNTVTAAQSWSEAVGFLLAAICYFLPVIGQQINGIETRPRPGLVDPGRKQIFNLADGLSESQRQDLAWASVNLLRNTSTTALLVCYKDRVVVARGFWDVPADSGPGTSEPLVWLRQKLDNKLSELSNLKEPFYTTANTVMNGWAVIPKDTESILLQPFWEDSSADNNMAIQGFLLLVSNAPYGYRRKDRAWVASLVKKLANSLCQ